MNIINHIYLLKEKLLTKITTASFLWRLFFVSIAGAALSFIQAPYNCWILMFPCFGIFYIIYTTLTTKLQVFYCGFAFAFFYFVFGLHWIGNALLVEGNDYKWVWPLAVIALPALLSLFSALYVTIAHIIFPKKSSALGFLGFCALLGLSEWTRGYAFTGFPWNLYGYGWIEVLPIAQSVSLISSYGLTLLTIIWGASAGFLILSTSRRDQIIISMICIISFVGLYVFGAYRLNHASNDAHENINIHIVQPNINQADKWKAEQLVVNFEKHLQLSVVEKTDKKNIIIWPETSLPPAFLNNDAVNQRIYSILSDGDILLAGGLDVSQSDDSAPQYHNALMVWKDGEPAERIYSKSHLVPFGEYIPFQKYIPIPTITNFSGFKKGNGAQTIKIDDFPSFSPLICYEVIFPNETVSKDDVRPDYILTVTNDGWYGDSAGPYQHFVQARFRAIEQGLPVVRAANTGISGIIDPYGRVIIQTKLLEATSISGDLPQP